MLVIITEDCKPMKQILELFFYGKYGNRVLQCLSLNCPYLLSLFPQGPFYSMLK